MYVGGGGGSSVSGPVSRGSNGWTLLDILDYDIYFSNDFSN